MRYGRPLILMLLSGSIPAVAWAQPSGGDVIVREALRRINPGPGAGDAAGGPDVIVGEIEADGCCPQATNISAFGSQGSILAYALGTSSCNIASVAGGGQHLLWRTTTPFHPIIPQNLYRLKTVNGSTRFEQIGQSWSKYAFAALQDNVCNLGCSGVGGSVLGMGCSDPYSAGLNASQGSLGPRYECNPFTGAFPDSTAVRSAWPAISGSTIARRLQVQQSDVTASLNPGALYFGESLYISRDDHCWGNSKNNASYRRCVFATDTTLQLQGTSNGVATATVRGVPAIFAWRDNGGGVGVVDAGVMITEVTSGNTFFTQPAYPYNGAQGAGTTLVLPAGDGWLYVASRATSLGGGVWHYEYAVENLNSDRGIGSFRVDFPAGASITNAEVRQVNCHSGTAADDANRNAAWAQNIGATSITWSTPHTWNAGTPALGSYLRWGTLYNFRFDANVAPATGGNATLGFFKPLSGYVDSITAAAHVPGQGLPPCYANCDQSTGTPMLTSNDFQCFLNKFAAGDSYANCDGSSGVPSLTSNDFQCFLNKFAGGCT